jgi:phosphogluconate dehydratase
MFEAVAMLGICDKIVPGLLIGALRFGPLADALILPGRWRPASPTRKSSASGNCSPKGRWGKEELLAAEAASYHGAGTCTFYGTANSNQMMMELMGLHIPGAAFINPGTPLRQALTRAAVHRLAHLATTKSRPLGHVVDERAIVNAAVGLLATGGSTNHAIHIPAIARAAGILIDWSDLDALSAAVPMLARVYPNGSGDVNDFHHAGGIAFLTRTLRDAGLIHDDILSAGADEYAAYAGMPRLEGDCARLGRSSGKPQPRHARPVGNPFLHDGGMRLVSGNLGRAIFKTSAVVEDRWTIEAPCRTFSDQDEVLSAFSAGELDRTSSSSSVSRARAPMACPNSQAHPIAWRASGQGLQGRVSDGRAHVGRERQGPRRNPRLPRSLRRRPARPAAGRGPSAPLRLQRQSRSRRRGSRHAPSRRDPPPPLGTGRELFAFMRQAPRRRGGRVGNACGNGKRVMTIDEIMRLAPVIRACA